MVLDPLRSDRLKRAVANMERDLDAPYAPGFEIGQQQWRKVQACCGCRNGATDARVDRLVPLAIVGAIRPLDVRGQRDVPDRIDRSVDISTILCPQPDSPTPVELPLEHRTVKLSAGAFKHDMLARTEFLPWMH